MKPKQLIILAGGKGTRLKEETKEIPKPLVELFNGISILDILIKKNMSKFSKIYIFAGYKGTQIQNHVNKFFLNKQTEIKVLFEEKSMGTGGAFFLHEDQLEDLFVVINGDTWFDFDLSSLSMINTNSIVQLLVKETNDPFRYGTISLGENNKIKSFIEKSDKLLETNPLINSGCYLMKKNILKYIKGPCSLETDIFPMLVKDIAIEAFKGCGSFIDIGIPETLEYARKNKEFFKI